MTRHLSFALGLLLAFCLGAATAAPLPPSAVPEPLKSWVPWVLHGHEMLACPAPHDGSGEGACTWPSRLALEAGAQGATFHLDVAVHGAPAWVALPGEVGTWPQDVKVDGRALAVAVRDGRPMVQLPAGSHALTGTLRWETMPQDLQLPAATGTLQLTLDGRSVGRIPDADGRVWLQQQVSAAQGADELTVRTVRLVDDDIPLRVTTRFDIAMAGKPREVRLPAALLAGFVPESLESGLPARLQDDGELRVQGRPGNWTVEIRGRVMAPVKSLSLPEGAAEEVWSFVAHPELRTVAAEGLTSVDPKQLPLPDEWRRHPAFQVKPGQALKLVESRRGNPQPGANKLALERDIWLDFDGGGYTLHDRVSGNLSRSWRLEMRPPVALGRASADGGDQPITRRDGAAGDGVELRRGTVVLDADSRIEGHTRRLPGTAWAADFDTAAATLNLPPGWTLLHAGGVDRAGDSWVERWTLWDFFFVLLCTLAAAKLLGRWKALPVALALLLSWHMDGAPRVSWLVLLGLLALARVLPAGKLLNLATAGSRLCAVGVGLILLPFAVQQIRLSTYPSLERPSVLVDGEPDRRQALAYDAMTGGDAAMPAAAPAPIMQAEDRRVSRSASKVALGTYADKRDLSQVDPNAKVQTGPGLPAWRWARHRLTWQGPVLQAQELQLYLLPPVGTAALRLAGLALLVASLWLVASGLARRPRGEGGESGAGGNAPSPVGGVSVAALVTLVAASGLLCLPDAASATAPPPPPSPVGTVQAPEAPPSTLLDELRDKLSAPPDCLPQCASVARLFVQAQGSRVQLRLEVHALANASVPLPGQGANWRPTQVTVDGKPAVVRRDERGALWLAARAGVTQVVLVADVGDAASVEIALPMPAQEVTAQAEGWTLAGLDARGLTSGALSLSRTRAKGSASDGGTQRDALPPFVQVERLLHLGLRWTVETRVTRVGASHAPVRARVRLLQGESVNSDVVRVEDGHAIVQLGAEDTASFVSTLKEQAQLTLQSASEPQQIEAWTLDPGPQWHVGWSGIAPIQHVQGDRLAPRWRPWPGESVAIDVGKPAGVAGQTLTLDSLSLGFTPGLRATDVVAGARLRSSQGGNHRLQLPADAEFLGLSLDGQAQPLQPQGRELLVPISPGAHAIELRWREPRGMGLRFSTTPFGLGAAGVNGSIEVTVPTDRIVLAVGGPAVGPAVLFWGVFFAVAGLAWGLGRRRITPLGGLAWFLLGLGLIQTSLSGAVVVAGWFFALAARQRLVAGQAGPLTAWRRRGFNLAQGVLVLWTVLAAVVLLNTVRVGLLGHPDMMIAGNGSHAGLLRWYQDRYANEAGTAWLVSVPVLGYRLLMLSWALWLSASLLEWVQWAWRCFSEGGHWRRAAKPAATPAG